MPSTSSKPSPLKVSVVVPALNEEECIATVLEGLVSQPGVDEVVVVDGGSTDNTVKIVESFDVRLIHQSRPGFGEGVWEGFREASGNVLCIVDADASHDWTDIPKMRELIEQGNDFVLGSRYKGPLRYRGLFRYPWSTSDDDSLLHEWGNLSIVALCKLLHGYPLSDVMMGLQMFRREVLDRVKLEENTQAFEAELKLKVHQAGFKMAEFSTYERARIGGTAKLHPVYDGLATGKVILQEWWKQRRRRKTG